MSHYMPLGDDPYAEGYDAAKAGLSTLACPYTSEAHPQQHAHWMSGYAAWKRPANISTTGEQ
ncbi:hypothetical protein DF139_04935 [Burkholderia stagnalis]|uniref:ribosome modulation factor n=1 Tax=Burkholderia stagnalis TaxID=1503054 RepID=UPI000F594E6C|nr:Rmf/CrpP family protein [Burkholderia stagnalis]RQQ73111.1 hypothetical protein DF137_04550 [Burkholderia stagnalis]RQQ74602.1 hypothetical protein DF139_04935 [Burkholderia stagnalis]RQQ86756.1 hypothetical protein DF138_01275 [Burkholderia stagnalis]RQQ95502.1 hypothetical protein DF136_05060 [Burkholderia stagnalis]